MKNLQKIIALFAITLFFHGQLYAQTMTGRGATVPFTAYEAENARTNAIKLNYDATYRVIQSEASGREAVRLENTGHYVEFTLTKPANGLVIRYCMPDAPGGGGLTNSLALYINDQKHSDVSLTSKYSWIYGDFPYHNTPADRPHMFFDDKSVLLNQVYPVGTKIKLQKDGGNSAQYYVIDLLEAEEVAAASSQPSNSVSITSYGAVANDSSDDTQALKNAISAAVSQGKEVWIPAGEFTFNGSGTINITNNNVVIRGAGMWHTTLAGNGGRFMVKASNVQFHDFSVRGTTTARIDDAYQHTAIESDYHTENMQNLTIKNIWVEHTKVGFWIHNMNQLNIAGCRIRNIYADGMNLRKGTSNSVVEHNHVRNTGDDCIALWSSEKSNAGNKIRYNTVQIPGLANGIALYGGRNNEISNNIISDIIYAGGGINISSEHSPVEFTGTVSVKNNTLLRTGSQGDWGVERGAVWINVPQNINADITIENNDIYNSRYQGVSFSNGGTVQNVYLLNNVFNTASKWWVYIAGDTRGHLCHNGNTVSNYANPVVRNDAGGNFSVTESCGSVAPSIVTVRFKAPVGWNEVAVYVYGKQQLEGMWPGRKLTGPDADAFYTYTFDKSGYTNVADMNIIFNNNNNGKQSNSIQTLSDGCWQLGELDHTDEHSQEHYSISSIVCNLPSGNGDVNNENSIKIYPNPTTGVVHIDNADEIKEIKVYDMTGLLIERITTTVNNINLSGNSAGIYHIIINSGNEKPVKKSIIKL